MNGIGIISPSQCAEKRRRNSALSSKYEEYEVKLREVEAIRRQTILAVGVATVTCLFATFLVPLLSVHVHQVRSLGDRELQFCRHRTVGLWREIAKTKQVGLFCSIYFFMFNIFLFLFTKFYIEYNLKIN